MADRNPPPFRHFSLAQDAILAAAAEELRSSSGSADGGEDEKKKGSDKGKADQASPSNPGTTFSSRAVP